MKEAKLYKIVRPVLNVLVKIAFRPKIINKEYIKKSGRLIIAGTHTDYYDPTLLMSSTKRCIHFMAKKELFEGKTGFFFRHMGLIPVDRSIKDKSVLINAKKYLEDEKVVGIFPEGTFSTEHKLLPFRIGTIKLAHDTNTPIVPFVIKGRFFKKGLKLIYGEPFYVVSDDLEYENKKFHDLIEKMIKEN